MPANVNRTELNWIVGKTIAQARVVRAGQNLEMIFNVHGFPHELVFELQNPDTLDWFDTDAMAIEETVGRLVTHAEETPLTNRYGEMFYTYRLGFADLSYIDIYADCRSTDPATGQPCQFRDRLFLSIRNPHDEPWDTDDRSILDELDAELAATRQRHAEAEAGQLIPQEQVKYVTHF